MSALQQQIDFALRDGIITKAKHQHLLANPNALAREYNISPFFLFKKSTDILDHMHLVFIQNLLRLKGEYSGAYCIDRMLHTDIFQMMTAILLRNRVEAWYYTVDDLLQFIQLEYDNKFTFPGKILFIPNIDILESESRTAFVHFINFALGQGVFLVLHFQNKSAIPESLNDYLYKVITDKFYKMESVCQ